MAGKVAYVRNIKGIYSLFAKKKEVKKYDKKTGWYSKIQGFMRIKIWTEKLWYPFYKSYSFVWLLFLNILLYGNNKKYYEEFFYVCDIENYEEVTEAKQWSSIINI